MENDVKNACIGKICVILRRNNKDKHGITDR